MNSLGVYLGYCPVENCRKQFAEKTFRSVMLVVTLVLRHQTVNHVVCSHLESRLAQQDFEACKGDTQDERGCKTRQINWGTLEGHIKST